MYKMATLVKKIIARKIENIDKTYSIGENKRNHECLWGVYVVKRYDNLWGGQGIWVADLKKRKISRKGRTRVGFLGDN